MFPIPFAALPDVPVSPKTTHQAKENGRSMYRKLSGMPYDFLIHCILPEDNGTRVAYLTIYSHSENGDRKIHCLNGTDSREEAKS